MNTSLSNLQLYRGIVAALIAILFSLAFITSRTDRRNQASLLIYSLIALEAYTLVSRGIYSVSEGGDYLTLATIVLSLPPLVWLLLAHLPPVAFRGILRCLVIGSAVAATIGAVLGWDVLERNVDARAWAAISMEVSANRNDFALIYLFALAAIVLVDLGFRPITRNALLGIILFGILFSFSRSAYVGLCILFISSFIYRKKSRLLIVLLAVLTAGAATVEGSLIGNRIAYTFEGRHGNFLDDSSEVRLHLWRSAIELFESSPVFGVGSGHPPIPTFSGAHAGIIYAHSYFITQLFQLGLVGLALTIIMLSAFLKESLRQQGGLRVFGVTSLAIVIGMSLTGEPLYGVALSVFYVIAAAMAWSNEPNRKRPSPVHEVTQNHANSRI